jgi:hypothetical protein
MRFAFGFALDVMDRASEDNLSTGRKLFASEVDVAIGHLAAPPTGTKSMPDELERARVDADRWAEDNRVPGVGPDRFRLRRPQPD